MTGERQTTTNALRGLMLVLACITVVPLQMLQAQASFQTKYFKIGLSNTGELTELTDRQTSKNYLPQGEQAFLLQIKLNGQVLQPSEVQWKSKPGELMITFPAPNAKAVVQVKEQDAYITFNLNQLTVAKEVDWIAWGPFPTTIADTVGEVVGVVRNRDFAIGIQALNIKTLGGSPLVDSDIQPSYDVFADGNKVDVLKEDLNKQLFRGDVAKYMPYGSLLQAYCRNRSKDRVIENWSHARYLAPAYTADGGVVGSSLAIFGVPTGQALSTLSALEVKEGLPHPMLDGVWGKQARHATASYLIMDFGEQNLEEALALTKQAGLGYLYHGDPFESWGHFKLKPRDFPNNWSSLKACVDRAAAQQVKLGVHTLSNFITTNDAYVTPVPDKRLARVGYSTLTEAIGADSKEIPIADPGFFNQFKNNTLKAAVVGNEIIRYGKVSETAPWKLLDCQRGAFGSKASSHAANDSIGKLMDHAYKVFLGNHALDQEMARTIARLFNETGLMQISFDGLEGCWSEGMGDYGKQLFTKTWFDNLKPELKGHVINDASNPGHFFWHIYTRMNWGEPWYAGFRESQLQLRLKNQQFYRRNLMPSMLGWFSLRAETTPEDIEWMLALGTGYDAGFGLSTSLETVRRHGKKEEMLALINLWEKARLADIFNVDQKERLRSLKNEFHLEADGNSGYLLTPIYNAYFRHKQQLKQPGEPVFSSFEFNNPAAEQPLRFSISLAPGNETDPDVNFEEISIAVNAQDALQLPVSLTRNTIIQCDGKTVQVYNRQWQLQKTLELSKPLPVLKNGSNTIVFDGRYSGENGAEVKLEIRAGGATESIAAKNN